MGHVSSAEEIRQEHLQAFGPNLGPVYNALHNDVAWLHQKWLEYRKLYAESRERIDLLNGAACEFFGILQFVLWRDVLLHIARLTDPPKTGSFENLTLRRLPTEVEDEGLAGEISSLVGDALARSEFARKLRNKIFAHTDFIQAIEAEPLRVGSRDDVEQALRCIRAVLNRLHVSYMGGEVRFDRFMKSFRDADELVRLLEVALKAQDCLRQRPGECGLSMEAGECNR